MHLLLAAFWKAFHGDLVDIINCSISVGHFEGKKFILFINLVEMYGDIFAEIKSEFSVPFQVGEEKAFVDVNNSNYISFKCCGIRAAMLCWSFVQFPFSLRDRGLEEDVVEGLHFWVLPPFLPLWFSTDSVIPKQLTCSTEASCVSSLLPFCCSSSHLNLSLCF